MPDPNAPECIDRAAFLIRAAAAAPHEAERSRLLRDAETWLLLARQQLLAARAEADLPTPSPTPRP
jgi:hypothetical protein